MTGRNPSELSILPMASVILLPWRRSRALTATEICRNRPRQTVKMPGMAMLHFVAGKTGAGKTTLARQIARNAPAVLICEDEWMSRLAEPIENLQQYLAAAAKNSQGDRPAVC